MNTQQISNIRRMSTRLSTALLVILLFLPACAMRTQPAGIKEITFLSGEVKKEHSFTLEDLNRLDPNDPVLLTLGSGWSYAPGYLDQIEKWLRSLKP